ncbi:single-stranded DNA-binding protein [Pseudoclavibacter terrae]|uniref:Single-stranded DNA-binding protein n=1 Tax=Pseudoclavibacter terrae TaxID=1530195 RepID=A0A7J5AXE9_9MICO|nr:single-stranded DNA-binding protein [Pseudoclavibacter terrae]KAB1636118.1 single-stranded DNA-binding protein [Pseudoclavibacter terrae]
MFTQITRTGNLTKTPTLFRDQDGGKYTYASIACSRRYRDKESGEWQSGPRIVYDVHVTGNLAAAVVDLATRCGNVALEFTGRLIEEVDEAGTIRQKVYADNVTVSLRGQNVTVDRPKGKPRQGPDLAAEASSAWEEKAD